MKATSDHSMGYRHRPLSILAAGAALMLTLGTSVSVLADSRQASSQGFAAMESLAAGELRETRGKDRHILQLNNVQSIQEMQSTVSDSSFNVVNGNMVSGNINFDANAMGGYSGTGIFSAVTGNGNSINNAVGISVFISE
ncbi:hypothetical protein [Halomonas ramblicola]|uniref:hypothetical protein n=1 Tax=Halomonas ramblicola TaxID=747349 RepID=UPI0025B4C246|nr:hypothetical protein [Halomonas ramblicola]MDN3523262.1 hypothetical protein [Halomonas ramblicola]